VDILLDDPGRRVIGVSRSRERSGLFLRYKLRGDLSRYTYHRIDLNKDMKRLFEILDAERPSWVVNFAAQSEVGPSWLHPEQWIQTNCVALAELVHYLKEQSWLERYLHVSSPEVYGTCVGTVGEDAPLNPSTPYAASKAAADLLLKTYREQFDLPLLTVRSTNVYGARQQLFKIVPRSMIYMKLGRTIPLHGGGKAVKSYIHIRDISRGELAILEKGRLGQIYHLSPDRGVSIRDLVAMICERMGRPFDEATETVDERQGQDAAYVIDSSKARQELGWSPEIGLEEGLQEVADWVEGRWEEIQRQPLEYQHKP